LIAQGYDAYDAAVLGAFIHGRAGDTAATLYGHAGMVAGDILQAVPLVLKEMYDLWAKHCKN
jgi:NAD(P)H-hydrate epimerase